MPENWQESGFGLYVHWPFCQSKCPYCDFNSHVSSNVDQNRWANALISEIERVGAETHGRVLGSIFFGGGTPSLMLPGTVDAILTAARNTWSFANDMEITLEANPTSVEAERFANFRDSGVNRVSMGIQALNDTDLKALGRLHTTQEAMKAFDTASRIFDRISFDLIYARQHQTASEWESELQRALNMAVDHVSLYQLTIEDGTAFGDRLARGKLTGLPDEDRAIDMWEITQQVTNNAGFAGYEVSNHAKLGANCKHNLLYWQGGDYIGIGPGAHGRVTLGPNRFATEAHLAPGNWLKNVEDHRSGESLRISLSARECWEEYLMMGLRLHSGIPKERFFGQKNPSLNNKYNMLANIGMLETANDKIRVTEKGRPLLNAVLRGIMCISSDFI